MIADYQMPGLDGADLAAAVRADARLRDTVYVMLTSVGHAREIEGVRRGHVDACLVKPVRYERLMHDAGGGVDEAARRRPVRPTRRALRRRRPPASSPRRRRACWSWKTTP